MSSIKSSGTKFPKKPPEMKPLMLLKDLMIDDLGSCSSNGFKSFPRCCSATTVRFILDRDLKKAKTASSAISALQRALNAVRNMQFPSVNATSSRRLRLPRSLSRRLLSKRSFWKRSEIGRLRSLREYLEEKYQPSDSVTVTTDTTAVMVTTTASNSNSWSGSEFSVDYLPSLSGNSEVFGENDDVGAKKKSNKDSMQGSNVKNEWQIDEKEQFSPVSVLDFPFDDEFDVSWPFRRHRPSPTQGENQKPLENFRRFDSIKLEPMNLEKKFISSESDNNELNKSSNEYVSISTKKAEELLGSMRTKIPSTYNSKCKLNKVLLDFFKDRIEKKFDGKQLLKVAEDWLNGNGNQMLLDWQVEEGRKAYIVDMEEDKKWRNEDLEETEEVGLDVEVSVWTCLVDELVLDVFLI